MVASRFTPKLINYLVMSDAKRAPHSVRLLAKVIAYLAAFSDVVWLGFACPLGPCIPRS